MTITPLEAKFINHIKHDFRSYTYGNFTELSLDDYLHLNGRLPIDPKQARGVLTSLKRKQVIEYVNDPHCWNPIYIGKKWQEALAIAEAYEA